MSNDTLEAALHDACGMAATDFPAAADFLRPVLAQESLANLLTCIGQLLSVPDPGAIYCSILLTAQAHSPDWAAEAGWHALDLGCDDDAVLMALGDVLQVQQQPREPATRMMRRFCPERRSTAFVIKLADHYRTEGHAFLTEDLLAGLIRQGRRDLMIRLAEHWVEFHDWCSARGLLRQVAPQQMPVEALYLLGRCCISLLLETEVFQCAERLASLPEPGPRYAALLASIWTWRVGDPGAAASSCPDGAFPPLMERDAALLRGLRGDPASPHAGQPMPAVWRDVGSRRDLPNVLGIGMQRSGTSWLWKQLSRHPDVQPLTFKELVFFNDPFRVLENYPSDLREPELGDAGRLYWQGPARNFGHYRNLFADSRPFRVDISPAYGELPEEAVACVRDILGSDTKILLCVRDPVERSWSNLKYNLEATGEQPSNLSFDQRIALYRNVATQRRCNYPLTVRIWRRFFHDVLVLFLDDIEARPSEVLASVHHFTGLSPRPYDGGRSPVNRTDAIAMPREDRLFLLGLHQPTYDASEAELGGPALGWRQRQIERLA